MLGVDVVGDKIVTGWGALERSRSDFAKEVDATVGGRKRVDC